MHDERIKRRSLRYQMATFERPVIYSIELSNTQIHCQLFFGNALIDYTSGMTDEHLKPLTSDQVSRLRKTFRSMNTDRLAMRFYSSLFARYPHLKDLFPHDLTELATKIVSVFELVVFSFKEETPGAYHLQQEVLVPLKKLGQLHTQKGVENKFYPLVNEVLLDSIKTESPEFSYETEVAWRSALGHLTASMIGGSSEHAALPSTMRESYQEIKSILGTEDANGFPTS